MVNATQSSPTIHRVHEQLAEALKDELAAHLRGLLTDCPTVVVDNLDRIMFGVIRDADLPWPGYQGEDADRRVAEAAIQAVRTGAGPRFSYILVDQAQDFCTEALRFITLLFESGRDDLLVVADAAPNIFRRNFRWKDAGIQAVGRSWVLRRNYRNTRQILDFAYRFLALGLPPNGSDADEEHEIVQPEPDGNGPAA